MTRPVTTLQEEHSTARGLVARAPSSCCARHPVPRPQTVRGDMLSPNGGGRCEAGQRRVYSDRATRPGWRNRHTRAPQKRLPERACGFESRSRHHRRPTRTRTPPPAPLPASAACAPARIAHLPHPLILPPPHTFPRIHPFRPTRPMPPLVPPSPQPQPQSREQAPNFRLSVLPAGWHPEPGTPCPRRLGISSLPRVLTGWGRGTAGGARLPAPRRRSTPVVGAETV